jgi:tetratricopeptide (TPR) repeat protein
MSGKLMGKASVTLFCVCLAVLVASPSISAAFKKVDVGDRPPAFTMKELGGGERKSEDLFAGKVTVLLFWATWSPRSLEVLKDLESLVAELDSDQIQVLAINAEHPTISTSDEGIIRKAVSDIGSSATILLDDGLVAYNDYGAMALPSMLVADKEGIVSFAMAGYPMTMRGDLPEAVKKALGLISAEDVVVVEEYVPKNSALMYYNMGKRLYEKGQDEKAEGQLLQSVERDPEFIKPHLLLGVYYKKIGENDKALQEFQRVRELDPRDNEAGYQTAAVSLRAKKYGEAEKLFDELLAEYPEKEEFAVGLALAHKYQGHDEDYARVWEASKGLYPAEARYCYDLGAVAEEAGDLAKAAVLYRRALDKSFGKSK